jgi:hypothetical protein
VDGEKLSGETPVAPGSTIRFGDASVVFDPDDDALGIGKGAPGTKVMGAVNVPAAPAPKAAPAPAPAPKAAGQASAPAAAPAASKPAPSKPAAKPAARKAPEPAGGAPKWLIPVIALVVIAAVAAFFLLKR